MAPALNHPPVARPAAAAPPAPASTPPSAPARHAPPDAVAPRSRLYYARQLVFGGTLGAVSLSLSGAFPVGHARAAHDWTPGSTGCFRSPQLEQLVAMMHPHEGRFALGFGAAGTLGYVILALGARARRAPDDGTGGA